MATPWDARTYDRPNAPQQAGAVEVLTRLADIAPDATVLDVGCGTGRVTEMLHELVPEGGCWPSTRRPRWCNSRADASGNARRSGARTCSASTLSSRSMRLFRPRRCIGSPTTIACGPGWAVRCGQEAGWKSSAEEKAT